MRHSIDGQNALLASPHWSVGNALCVPFQTTSSINKATFQFQARANPPSVCAALRVKKPEVAATSANGQEFHEFGGLHERIESFSPKSSSCASSNRCGMVKLHLIEIHLIYGQHLPTSSDANTEAQSRCNDQEFFCTACASSTLGPKKCRLDLVFLAIRFVLV